MKGLQQPIARDMPIRVEDQRGKTIAPETGLDVLVRGIRNNWQDGGLAGLLGLNQVLPAKEIHIPQFRGPGYKLDVSKIAPDAKLMPPPLRGRPVVAVRDPKTMQLPQPTDGWSW